MEKVKNTILLVLLFLVPVVFVGCKRAAKAQADEVVINGKLANSSGKIVWLREFDGTTTHLIDSVQIEEDESFSFRTKVKNAGFYTISIRKNDIALLIGDKGETITLTGDAAHLSNTWKAKGSKETSLYFDYWNVSRQQLKRIDSITFIFRTSQMNPEYMATRISLDSIFNSIMEKQREDATHFVTKNPASLASLLVIDAKCSKNPLFYEERDVNYFKMLDSGLSKTYKDNKLVNDFHNRVEKIMKRIKNHQENNRLIPPGDLSPSYMPNR